MFQVYLVDDNPLLIEDIKTQAPWQENGFEICGSSVSAAIAIQEIVQLNPELVICDLKMPKMDGIEMIRELKGKGVNCEYVMLSAYSSFEDSRHFFLQDGFDYLIKPLDMMDLQIVLERLARKLLKKNAVSHNERIREEGKEKIDEIMSYLARNYSQKITLEQLGERFHLNPNYVSNLFTKNYNQTLTVFLTNFRMDKAANLIAGTNKPLKEIAALCGYSNYFYFCKVFKEYYEVSPGEYSVHNRSNRE